MRYYLVCSRRTEVTVVDGCRYFDWHSRVSGPALSREDAEAMVERGNVFSPGSEYYFVEVEQPDGSNWLKEVA